MNLGDLFQAVAHKKLQLIDLPDADSLKHEMKGGHALRSFFGMDNGKSVKAIWHYYADDHEPEMEDGIFRLDTREVKKSEHVGNPQRRLHYKGDFLCRANVGDWFLLAKTKNSQYFGLVFQANSNWLRMAKVLFEIRQTRPIFEIIPQVDLMKTKIDFLRIQLIYQLELEVNISVDSADKDIIMKKFVRQFSP